MAPRCFFRHLTVVSGPTPSRPADGGSPPPPPPTSTPRGDPRGRKRQRATPEGGNGSEATPEEGRQRTRQGARGCSSHPAVAQLHGVARLRSGRLSGAGRPRTHIHVAQLHHHPLVRCGTERSGAAPRRRVARRGRQ
eukprot:gene25909-biopygen19533